MFKHYSFLILVALLPFLSNAQDGTLDTSFGDNGTVVETFSNADSEFLDILKTNDALYATGFSSTTGNEKISVAKFDLNGNLDTSFGDNGLLVLDIGSFDGRATTILQQADEKLVVAGWTRFGNKDQYVVARVNLDGTIDSDFATDGIATGSFSGSSFAEDEIMEAGFLSDEKIVFAGRSYNGSSEDGFVGCLNTDGSLNTDFGNGGSVIIDFPGGPPSEVATALAINDQDEIFIGGTVSLEFGEERSLFVTKVDANGTIDTNFGDSGSSIYTINPNTIAGLNALAIDAQGRVLTGGGAFDTDELDNNFFLTRFNPNGSLDNSFGNNGIVVLQKSSNEAISDLEILDNEVILAAGSTGGFNSRFLMARLGPNGNQDMSFGTDGFSSLLVESTFNGMRGIAIDDGCVYGAGFGYDGDIYKSVIAKFFNQNPISNIEDSPSIEVSIAIFPNPISSEFFMEFQLLNASKVSIQLADFSGKIIASLLPQTHFPKGSQKLRLTLPNDISSGHYQVMVQVNEELMTSKVVKL